jgi:hypothetical protein
MDLKPGTFYDMPRGFLLPLKELVAGTQVTVGQRLAVSCMFDIYMAYLDKERVGFYFTTRFAVENCGGYLITTLSGKDEATEVETLIKTDELIVYNYPNKGTLAITPLVSEEVLRIFEEQ